MAIVVSDFRAVMFAIVVPIDIFFVLSDGYSDFNRRKGTAFTLLFVLIVFQIPLYFGGIYFNWFRLTPTELKKTAEVVPNGIFTLSAFA